MEQAISNQTGSPVNAKHALSGHYRYRCPLCDAPVFLRRGSKRAPTFAHEDHTAPADCENYHPGAGGALPAGDTIHGLSLYLVVPDSLSGRPAWQIELRIPPPSDGMLKGGTVRIPFGLPGVRTSPIANIGATGWNVQVKPRSELYQCLTEGLIDTKYGARLREGAAGLDIKQPSIFRNDTTRGNRLKPRVPLWWGFTYYLVWHRESTFTVLPQFLLRQLRDIDEWKAAECVLPAVADNLVENWTRLVLGREIVYAPLMPTVVAPMPLQLVDHDTWVLPSGDEVLIGAPRQIGTNPPTLVWIRMEGKTWELPLPGKLPVVFSLGKLPQGDVEIRFPGSTDAALLLHVCESSPPPQLETAHLVFNDISTDIKTRVPFFSDAAAKSIVDSYAGATKLVGMHLPERTIAGVRVRQFRGGHWNSVEFDQYVPEPPQIPLQLHQAQTAKLLDAVLQALNDRNAIQIDARNFGFVEAQPWQPNEMQSAPPGALPLTLRSQLRWLRPLAASLPESASASGEGIRLLERNLIAGVPISTADLTVLHRLCAAGRWPAHMEPHLRVLASTIAMLIAQRNAR